MTQSPLRLREIAALSWTAARTGDGNVEEIIENLQRAVSVTRRWLAEVESEIASQIGVRKTRSDDERDSAHDRPASPPHSPRRCHISTSLEGLQERQIYNAGYERLAVALSHVRGLFCSCGGGADGDCGAFDGFWGREEEEEEGAEETN